MAILTKEGFDFSFDTDGCRECLGNCCIGESGYIWVTPKEIENIAKFLNISIDEVKISYLDKIKYRFSIKEIEMDENNFACIFFDINKRGCKIYEVRPTQCKSFPFWDYFKDKKEEVKKECPAIK